MNTKTLAIKARLANHIRKMIYQNISGKQALSQSMKIAMFDNWLLEAWAMHTELNDYKQKRKDKARLQKEREARGWKPKKKTSLEEYKFQQNLIENRDLIKAHLDGEFDPEVLNPK